LVSYSAAKQEILVCCTSTVGCGSLCIKKCTLIFYILGVNAHKPGTYIYIYIYIYIYSNMACQELHSQDLETHTFLAASAGVTIVVGLAY